MTSPRDEVRILGQLTEQETPEEPGLHLHEPAITAADRPTKPDQEQPASLSNPPPAEPADPNRASPKQVGEIRVLVKKLRMAGPTEAEARAMTRDQADRTIQQLAGHRAPSRERQRHTGAAAREADPRGPSADARA